MKEKLEYYFKTLLEVFSTEQTVYILLYNLFSLYLENSQNWDCISGEDSQLFYEKKLVELFRDADSYDVKQAAWTLDRMIDWDFINKYEPVRKKLLNVVRPLRNTGIHTTEELNEGIEAVIELFSQDGQVMVTPEDIKCTIADLVRPISFDSMAEFCCGFSGIGLEVLRQRKPGTACVPVSYYGEDINNFCCAISKLWLYLNGFTSTDIVSRNTLFFEEEKVRPGEFDLILADIPKGMNESLSIDKKDKRFIENPGKTIYTDWIFIQDILYRLSKRGKAFIIVTKGALVRKNELEFRRQLIEKDWLEAVITLPQNLYTNTNIGMELLIFNKNKQREFKKKVLFINLSAFGYRKSRKQYGISREGLDRLLSCYECKNPDGEISRWVECSEIGRFDYTLNPFFYLEMEKTAEDPGGSIELGKIAAVTRGVQINKEEERVLSENGTHFLLNIRNIEDGFITCDDCSLIREKTYAWRDKFEIREDDIVLTTKGTVFKMALVRKNPPLAFISGNLTIIRVNRKYYHPYVLYEFLQSDEGRARLESVQTGTTIKVLNSSSLMKIKVPMYEDGVTKQVGEELKKNRERFLKKREEMEQEYEDNKASWLNLLKRGK